ncbi:hypothetical protein LAD73_01560 [Mycoplasma sp. 1331]|uniref:YqaJ viral recombinase domain-containing protein n=1 Tax=Mycoplasma tauri TaxID=547987 RepID=A0A953T6P8_9MOLU|nr:hypothetical protein [Mycoplasma tauri]MBZ4195406.1 hypothetical protein [Mycoplasma tauri]
MRKFYNGRDYFVDESERVIILSDSMQQKLLNGNQFEKFKKLGGSSVGNILTPDRFNSDFKAFCHITRLSLPVLQRKYVRAGETLEPKIIDHLSTYFEKKFGPEFKIKHIEAKNVNYDYFKDEYVLGGVPDALIESKKIVFEIKTTQEKNWAAWTINGSVAQSMDKKDGVPLNYKKQAQLYTNLLNYDRFMIVGLFLKDEDYLNPEKVNVAERKMELFQYKVKNNRELELQIADDKEKLIKFHEKYSLHKEKISPQYDLINDIDQVEYLKCKNEQEWEELFNKWKKLGKIDQDIDFKNV